MGGPGLYFPFIKGDLGGPNFSFASIDRYWDRVSRSFFLIVLFFSLFGFNAVSRAETAPSAELEALLQKIASRHYRWIAIRADVLLFFAKEGDPNAMCGGELLYQRLDERMFLTCVDTRQELMFVFRTLDRRFDLYLPSQNTVYHGSIFDMEDSPDIESHLKARDLYRALKPMAVDPRRAKIERTNSAITSLDVYGRNDEEGTLVRKLYLTPEGDVRGELFYDSKERPVTEIQRYDFRELRGNVGSYNSIIFPKKITIASPETKKGSAIFFTRVTALDTIDPLDFILRIPPGTKEVFLNEKDPRFQSSKQSEAESTAQRLVQRSEARPISKAERVAPMPSANNLKEATETPVPSPKKSQKVTPVLNPRSEEKLVNKILPPPVQEKEEVLKKEAPQAVPVQASAVTTAPENVDADLAVEAPAPSSPPSASDAQTTLDPSVGPSLEMGKQ
ncbi:MAG: hypothetical protein WCJ71_09325 [Candidatus Omnitrophota bacterium]